MITNDKGIVDLKHYIMREICRMEWEDTLTHENLEKLVYEISPGPKPEYRCCVYKEREIVRGRIRMAMGQDASADKPNKNVVQVNNTIKNMDVYLNVKIMKNIILL